MPKIPQHFLGCCIYLYDSKKSAKKGESFGGSGFLVSVESNPIWEAQVSNDPRRRKAALFFPPHIYAVTNKHVAHGGFPVIRLNTMGNEFDVLELEHDDWLPHPDGDDLVVASIDLPTDAHDYMSIRTHTFLHSDNLSSIGVGDDTFMVGRFITHAGRQRNTPSVRFGSIAMMPFEKVKVGNYMQEAFLVETRSISGYSGSPVFVYQPVEEMLTIPASRHSGYDAETHTTSISNLVGYPVLLGIDCGHIDKYEDVLDNKDQPHPYGWHVKSNTGMAIVIPAWRLYEFLNTDKDLVMQRKQKDKQFQEEQEAKKQTGSVTLDAEKRKDKGIAQEGFEDAIKHASRKIEKDEEQEP